MTELLMSHCIFPTPDILQTASFYERKMGFKAAHYLDAADLIFAYIAMRRKSS